MGNVIEIKHVGKDYRLGAISNKTLTQDLQSWWYTIRGKEDPNLRLGEKRHNKLFTALNDISFSVKKGDIVGLIGHNGAGKSTLLKLISRVTLPTRGEIVIDGRVASMLEVGTGFNLEMTGRENVYLNGAIMGMPKSEVDRKMSQIIEFSEVGKFIDTPVKRYSSGMFVKLAFSVASHIDNEIMLMDEVLAVGDMAFQQKCLRKMSGVVADEGRTIIYVSHNMETIRRLCNRCVVLNKGQVVLDAGVEEGIQYYMNNSLNLATYNNYENVKRHRDLIQLVKTIEMTVINKDDMFFSSRETMIAKIKLKGLQDLENVYIRFVIHYFDSAPKGMATSLEAFSIKQNEEKEVSFELNLEGLAIGKYYADLIIYTKDGYGHFENADGIDEAFSFEISDIGNRANKLNWVHPAWGYYVLDPIKILT